ncbi:MAG: ABC transporter ATP-binding protein [Clostridium sp.]|nr:ABC transporter ATP-binding protein [Clostridium sp.]
MIEIKNLSVELEEKEILHNINLKMDKGKIYGIIGPNGVGKTTLIKSLVGIYKNNKGSILYDGEEVYDNPKVKEKISYVADENNFFTSFTIKDIIKFYKMAYKNFKEEKFHSMNKIFNVNIKKRFYMLSKGTKMRVALMIAFAQCGEYMILDEPTSGLDPILKNKLLKLLQKEVKERNITIIISSHHLNELEKICDDIIIIDNGKVSYESSLDNMRKSIKKIQVAFDMPVYEEDLKGIKGIFKLSKVGRVFTIITDDYSEKFIDELKKFEPLFIEEIDLNLEDIFIYRLEEGSIDEEII